MVEESTSEVVAIIQPDAPGRVVSLDKTVSVLFPVLSRRHTFQAGISADDKHCLSRTAPPGLSLFCVRVDTFDEFGRAEVDGVLTMPATLNITLYEETGDLPEDVSTLTRALEAGGISLVFREYLGEEWIEIPYSLRLSSEGRVSVIVTRSRFGVFALIADPGMLAWADSDTPPTPTITPLPTPLPENSRPPPSGPGAAYGLLITILAPIIATFWYIGSIGLRW